MRASSSPTTRAIPIGTQDLSPLIGEASRSGADTFVAFSYPPDTMALTEQSKVASYAPKVMFLGVGVGFPMYPQRFGANVEGIMSLGGWSKDNASTAGLRQEARGDVQARPRPLGQPDRLFLAADARAGDRARRQDRPRRHHQGAADRHLRHRARQGEAGRQHDEGQFLADRPVAGRLLRRRGAAARRCRPPSWCRSRPGSRNRFDIERAACRWWPPASFVLRTGDRRCCSK